jgi:sepiapterin reductase
MINPVILLTGAGKGIGKSIVEELCERATHAQPELKPRLFLTSRTEADLVRMQQLAKKAGLAAEILAADIAKPADVEKIFAHCLKAFGGIDCLINNAGVGRFGNFLEMTAEDVEQTLATNLTGTFLLTQKVFGHMEKKRAGHLVFITSVAAIRPFEHSSVYCMSKAGQKGLLEVVRLLARKANIRVTNIMPGATLTPMWGDVAPDLKERMMPNRDVARAVIETLLVSDKTSIEEVIVRPTGGDI